jgi:hypothetical protein
MSEDEQIVAIFVNGITQITGSPQAADRVRTKIMEWKRHLWLLSIIFWSIILYVLVW